MAKKLIKVMDTSFRDGFQSVFGARVLTKDFMPAVAAAKEAGIKYFEFGGGAVGPQSFDHEYKEYYLKKFGYSGGAAKL